MTTRPREVSVKTNFPLGKNEPSESIFVQRLEILEEEENKSIYFSSTKDEVVIA